MGKEAEAHKKEEKKERGRSKHLHRQPQWGQEQTGAGVYWDIQTASGTTTFTRCREHVF